jgi:hypothetical protein
MQVDLVSRDLGLHKRSTLIVDPVGNLTRAAWSAVHGITNSAIHYNLSLFFSLEGTQCQHLLEKLTFWHIFCQVIALIADCHPARCRCIPGNQKRWVFNGQTLSKRRAQTLVCQERERWTSFSYYPSSLTTKSVWAAGKRKRKCCKGGNFHRIFF